MNDTPTIAILICNYNYGKFVGRAIDSALAQSSPPSQIIVVDDGSTDESVSVIEKYPGVELLLKANGGQVSAAMVGIESVRSDIIMFLDSDDYLYPDACADVLKEYHPSVSLIQFRLDKISGEKIVGSYPDFDFMKGDLKSKVLRHGFINSSPTTGNAFSTRHVRRMIETLQENEGRNFIDGYLIFSAPFTGDVKTINAPKGAYVIHGDNVSLSAGRTLRSVTNSIRNARWQRRGFLRLTLEVGSDLEAACGRMLAANSYRNALIVERGYGVRLLPEFSQATLALYASARFLRFPGMPLWQRIGNAVVVLCLTLAPAQLCRKLVPER